ncbi:uncharacterized protein At3g17950 [Rhodamnia argentea]|uniref:Uncharacterized protein At3g17950 n=1 Tax=Rhodamnia argentea TaxID=178133 RepID=A0A8B8PB10_9MYRT|nr:uncharacterized protein At3g17950 [Rhodamnia argentea]
MQDPANDLFPPPSSPTASSISSSDLDTESTGSFFHDRSTTLGTLMGVSFPAIAFRNPSQHREAHHQTTSSSSAAAAASGGGRKCKKPKKKKAVTAAAALVAERRRRWWRLCQDDGAKPASLGEFLEIERRFGDGAFYDGAPRSELDGIADSNNQQRNGRVLFADGRVLPPAVDVGDGTPSADGGALCRFSVSLTGLCS